MMLDVKASHLLPPGSCDCHMHIIDKRFPFMAGALPFNREATVCDYLGVRREYGLQRAVVVQATYYGTDNSCLLSALKHFGSTARGIAVVRSDVTTKELLELNAQGVQGIRCRMTDRPIVSWEEIPMLARKAADLNWHVQFQMDGRKLHERETFLRELPCEIVIEHTGKFIEPIDTGHPGPRALQRLLDTGRVWVKLSGTYNTSVSGAPKYADMRQLTQTLVRQAPERMVWASDWPYVLTEIEDRPDIQDLISAIYDWVPDINTRRKIFSENPKLLYKFQ